MVLYPDPQTDSANSMSNKVLALVQQPGCQERMPVTASALTISRGWFKWL